MLTVLVEHGLDTQKLNDQGFGCRTWTRLALEALEAASMIPQGSGGLVEVLAEGLRASGYWVPDEDF